MTVKMVHNLTKRVLTGGYENVIVDCTCSFARESTVEHATQTSLNISQERWELGEFPEFTSFCHTSLQDALNLRWFDAGPSLQTPAQHQTNTEPTHTVNCMERSPEVVHTTAGRDWGGFFGRSVVLSQGCGFWLHWFLVGWHYAVTQISTVSRTPCKLDSAIKCQTDPLNLTPQVEADHKSVSFLSDVNLMQDCLEITDAIFSRGDSSSCNKV